MKAAKQSFFFGVWHSEVRFCFLRCKFQLKRWTFVLITYKLSNCWNLRSSPCPCTLDTTPLLYCCSGWWQWIPLSPRWRLWFEVPTDSRSLKRWDYIGKFCLNVWLPQIFWANQSMCPCFVCLVINFCIDPTVFFPRQKVRRFWCIGMQRRQWQYWHKIFYELIDWSQVIFFMQGLEKGASFLHWCLENGNLWKRKLFNYYPLISSRIWSSLSPKGGGNMMQARYQQKAMSLPCGPLSGKRLHPSQRVHASNPY